MFSELLSVVYGFFVSLTNLPKEIFTTIFTEWWEKLFS